MVVIIDIQRPKMIEEGDYLAELKDVQEIQGKFGAMIRFWFNIIEPGYETSVTGICSKSGSLRSKLVKWALALGADISQPQINLSSLIGAKAIVSVNIVTGANGEEYLNVVDVKKVSRRMPSVQHVDSSLYQQEQYQQSMNQFVQQPIQQQQFVQQPMQQQFVNQPVQQPMNQIVQSMNQPIQQPMNQAVQQQPVTQQSINPQSNPINVDIKSKKNPLIEEIINLDELEF